MMRSRQTLLACLVLIASFGAVQAASLDLNLGSDAVQFEAAGELVKGIQLGGGVTNSDYREDATVYHAQLMGSQHTSRRELGVGARWTQYDTDIGDGGGLGLGGYGYVYLPNMPAVSLGGYGYYTPDAMTTSELEEGYEVGLRARYAFTPNVDGYLGLRQLDADFDEERGSRTLDRGAQAGVRLRF
ncbi:YfaZ family outer membrane protein [Halomonas halodenitrificans]|uniref:YfaZ family outer membrane protein n=1 Tax=Halomonas halodenitrificans TaxID=28252 RepID=UPI000A533612|nr:YfaZ family outer membrane protein [Halomonas halodenitrificans]